jgi:hypothetical protein
MTNLLDDVANLGRQMLGTSSAHTQLSQYRWQLATICDLMRHTHTLVVDRLDDIERATTVEEARRLAADLDEQPFTQALRANGLCDVFQGLGTSLLRLTQPKDGAAPTVSAPAWRRFCEVLQERELSVARMYLNEIRELGALVVAARGGGADLAALRQAAARTRDVLTVQRNDFEALATEFRRA